MTNELTVAPELLGARGPAARAPVAPVPAGEALRLAVEEQLRQDTRLDARSVRIEARGSHVVLSGTVPSEHQRRVAAEDARNVIGVVWVTNEISVIGPPRSDLEVREAIDAALAMDTHLFDSEIEASVEAGEARLHGIVRNGYERTRADLVVARVAGVRVIDNQLRVPDRQTTSDADLQREVERRLARSWGTAAIAGGIEVQVESGVAILRGRVVGYVDRRAVGLVAGRTPGITRVENLISVDSAPAPPEGETPPPIPGWDPYYYDQQAMPWPLASYRARPSRETLSSESVWPKEVPVGELES